jgi:toxin CcdB
MAQFDVYRNPNPKSAQTVPYLLDVQSDFLSGFSTRAVVPIAPTESVGKSAQRLHPQFQIDGANMVMMTELLAAVPKVALGAAVMSLAQNRDDIIAAMDFLITGI